MKRYNKKTRYIIRIVMILVALTLFIYHILTKVLLLMPKSYYEDTAMVTWESIVMPIIILTIIGVLIITRDKKIVNKEKK